MTPSDLDLLAALAGDHPAGMKRWAHQCHAASLALCRSGLLDSSARVARGACLGVAGQHSWVVLGDPYEDTTPIIDATRWSYVGEPPSIWRGSIKDGLHKPHGYGHIMDTGQPRCGDGEILAFDATGLSKEARFWLDDMFGGLDLRGWATLYHGGMIGWPAAEILDALLDAHPAVGALVPIDIQGMLLPDRNPENLYR